MLSAVNSGFRRSYSVTGNSPENPSPTFPVGHRPPREKKRPRPFPIGFGTANIFRIYIHTTINFPLAFPPTRPALRRDLFTEHQTASRCIPKHKVRPFGCYPVRLPADFARFHLMDKVSRSLGEATQFLRAWQSSSENNVSSR